VSPIRRYLRATDVDNALAAKSEFGGAAFYLAGGTDALVFTPASSTVAIDIMHLGLDSITSREGVIEIGATARLRDIERHPAILDVATGALVESLRETGPWLIRNQATLAGNICNASPSADSVPMLLALDAEVVLSDDSTIPLDRFFVGPHQNVLSNQMVASIRIHPRGRAGYFRKLSRSKSDIAQVNLAVTLTVENGLARDVRIALGSVSATPLRATRAEALVEGQSLTPDLRAKAAQTVRAEIRPIADWRATADYRRHAAGVMVQRALANLAGDVLDGSKQ